MKKKLFISVAALGLLVGGLIGCNNNNKSSEESQSSAPSSSQPAKPSSSSTTPSSSQTPSSSSQAPITQATVNQTVTPDGDNNGAKIVWDAQDGNKDASSGFNSSGKFGSAGDYVQYVFESPMAMNARLFVKIANRSGSNDSPYNRSTQSGNQSIWYDYYNGPGWKYTATVNGAVIDQDAMAKYTIGEEEIDMKELTYSDFASSTSSSEQFVVPWFEFKANEGKNVIRMERTLGYSVSVKEFQVIGRKEGAGPAPTPSSSSSEPSSSSTQPGPSSSSEPSSSSQAPAFEGYDVTFVPGEHCKVLVFPGADYTVDPVETNTTKAKDKNGNIVEYDIEDVDPQPQVNFKVVCDEGYVVNKADITVTGTYKNLKQGPDEAEKLPAAEYFRITKVQTNLTVTITPVEDTGAEVTPGYVATFIPSHCQIKVYIGPKDETGSNVDEGPEYYTRNKDDATKYSRNKGQLNFEVIPDAGYKFVSGLNVKDGEATNYEGLVPFVACKEYNKVVREAENFYRITGINADLAIKIRCIPEAGEEGLGYEISFVTTNCHVEVYDTQDYQFDPVVPENNKALSRTDNGDAAKYVAKVTGVDANGDGDYDDEGDTKPVDEVKPQINFRVVCDEGYEFDSGVAVDQEGKDLSFITGNYNKLKNMGNNIYRVTKIQGDLVITITATAVVA